MSMTRMLEKAFKEAAKLPNVEQNALAKWLLEELAAEGKWQQAFTESEETLDRLADEALEAHAQGRTKPIDADNL